MLNIKKILIANLILLTTVAKADLQSLDSEELQEVSGQGGADFSLVLRLNHTLTDVYDTSLNVCSSFEYCRLGVSLNNRNDDGSVTGSATGKKLWLVFKGIQGTINIQLIKFDGTDIPAYLGKDNTTVTNKTALQLGFDPSKPILIRNLGYQSLSLETDSVINEGAGNIPGYLAKGSGGSGIGAFFNGKYTNNTTNKFDFDREVGFTGLNINGNISLSGTMKVFGCTNHPRC